MDGNTLSLHRRTIKLLQDCPRPLLTIAEDTGIGYHWLRKFKAGRFQNPGVNSVQALYEYLLRRKLGL